MRTANERDFSGVISLSPLSHGASADLAFGFADRGHRVPNDIGTRFAMASGSKVFTAVAVGLLIEEGKISLGTRLEECVRSREFGFASEVTIGQLLSHTSGVPDYFDEEKHTDFAELWRDRPCYRMTSVRDFLPLFEKGTMKALPGSGFHYSNSGYILLGLVIEELTGSDFRDFIGERIFRDCEMTRTGYFAMDALPENTALGYLSQAKDEWHTNIYSVPSIGGPDGGAFTTIADMRSFWTFLLAGRILVKGMVEQFLFPSVRIKDDDESRFYGYGVWLQKWRGNWVVSTIGNDPGVSMVSRVWPGNGLIMTILSNVHDGAWSMSRVLGDRINQV